MQTYRWLTTPHDILNDPTVRANASMLAFCTLMCSQGRRPVGAATIVFRDLVLQFGVPTEAGARALTRAHVEGLDSFAGTAPSARSASDPLPASECGFDLSLPDLGLLTEVDRRFPQAVIRDDRPGQWVFPVAKINDAAFFTRVIAQRNLGMGEAFLAGEFEMLRGSVHHLISFIVANRIDRGVTMPVKEQAKLVMQYAKWRLDHSHNEDIADHYDIGDNIMIPMLGATGCYSCGYMEHETDDLDTMQVNKINLIFSKMRLTPGMRILDTGCGNGGMLTHAALAWGCEGVGFTNSFNMAALARRNAQSNGVGDQVTIHHADFSLLSTFPDESFDAIYEVGVWEHLAFDDYEKVMNECHRILKPHGRMLIHSMGSHEKKHFRDGYIQKYIFRDSNQIRLHLLLDEARKHDMYVGDVENIARHYYWTLWWWRHNLFDAFENDPSISEHDFRVMLYFLECGMTASRFGNGSLYQLLLFKEARDHTYTWRVDERVDGRVNGEGMQHRPFAMIPSNANPALHLASGPDKLAEPVYANPPITKRMRQLLSSIRNTRMH